MFFRPFSFYRDINSPSSPPQPSPGGLDPDAEAFLTATGITDETITNAINNLVLDLKAESLWNKFNALYPFVGGTADTHKYNLMDPRDADGAYRISWSGTVTHNSNGITGNGTSGYGNTFLSAANSGGGTDDVHYSSYWKNYTGRNATSDFGAHNGSSYTYLNIRNASNIAASSLNATSAQSTTSTTATTAFHTLSRTSSASFTSSINKSHTTRARTSIAAASQNMYILAANNNGTVGSFSNRNCAFFGIGFGLTTAQIDTLVDINTTFQTTLGRL